jgi:hypothetical protein
MRDGGDCYEAATRILFDHPRPSDPDNWRIVHGRILSLGIRHLHAWLEHKPANAEIDWWVHDYSNGKTLEIPAAIYYMLRTIDPAEVRSYTLKRARDLMIETEVYGPWHDTDPGPTQEGD